MVEKRDRTLDIRDILNQSQAEILPNGDTLFIALHYKVPPTYLEEKFTGKFSTIFSPSAIKLLGNSQFVDLLDREYTSKNIHGKTVRKGIRGFVVKENIGNIVSRFEVAVKTLLPYALDMTGIEQFRAMRGLQNMGVRCAEPMTATQWRLITKWVNGRPAYYVEQALEPYLIALTGVGEQLRQTGVWESSWRIDHQPANYIIRDLKAENPLERFIAVDPVCIHSAFEFG